MEVDPFPGLKLTNPDVLESLEGRTVCPKCNKSRKYFCYSCYVPVAGLEHKLPRIKLPLKIDIIKHPNEVEGKSTSGHAVVLAPDDVTIYSFPCIPDYDPSQDILVFPCEDAQTLEEFLRQRCDVEESNGTPSSPCQAGGSLVTSTAADEDTDSIAAKSNADKGKPEPSEESETDRSAEEHSPNTTAADVSEEAAETERTCKGCQVTDCTEVKEAAEGDQTTLETKRGLSGSTGDAERNSGAGEAEEVTESGNQKRKIMDVADDAEVNTSGEPLVPAKIPRTVFSARIPKVIFVDSTWKQTKRIVFDERLKSLPRLELRSRTTKFWRSQQDLPMTCLSTIEAIYYFVCDYHALTCPQPYAGQYDDLLLFFMSTYHRIRRASNGANIKAYNR